MLRAFNVFTREGHDSIRAAREIQAQIEAFPLDENNLGLMVCEQEFIDQGIAAAVAAVLPFPCVGINTTISCVQGAADIHLLSLIILTSDDITFELFLSEPVTDISRSTPLSPFRNIHLDGSEPPSLILAFSPMLFDVGVDEEIFFHMLDEAVGPIPVFGSLAVNYVDGDYIGSRILHNRRHYRDRAILVMLRGPVRPRFAFGSIPSGCIIAQDAVITKSHNTVLMEINNRPVLEFLKELGLYTGNKLTGAHAYPFNINPGNGQPSYNTITYGMTPEGYLLCGKAVPRGGTMSLIAQDYASVMKTTREVMQAIKDCGSANAVLVFSCHGRSINLGFEDMAEVELVKETFPGTPPFLLAYSGGEICPVRNNNGEQASRLFSHTLVACIL